VKQIYQLQQREPGKHVLMGRLAEAMGVVPGTATTMIKALADSGLVKYAPRSGVRLTRGGEQLALHVLRRHRLIELFLVKTLGLDWSEVHPEAEELEHAISDKVLDRIDAMLGHPKTDPHGDPIPSRKGEVASTPSNSLLDCTTGRTHRITRVLDQESGFLDFLKRHELTPGMSVAVEQRDAAAGALTVRVASGASVTLGHTAAAKILVARSRANS
jgi:DtxR family Mn-dependent transcriptional regulator